MTERLSIRIDAEMIHRLDALARRSKRSRSFLAAEAVTAYVQSEAWQFSEIDVGVSDLADGRTVGHDRVSKWLKSWGKPDEGKPPR